MNRIETTATNGNTLRIDVTDAGLKVSILKNRHFQGVALIPLDQAAHIMAFLNSADVQATLNS